MARGSGREERTEESYCKRLKGRETVVWDQTRGIRKEEENWEVEEEKDEGSVKKDNNGKSKQMKRERGK